MEYNALTTQDEKLQWTNWLENQIFLLQQKEENPNENGLFETPDGDVATAKDLVGTLLATLTNTKITI